MITVFDHRWPGSYRYAVVDTVWREELPAHWPTTVVAPDFLGPDTGRCPQLLDMHALVDQEKAELGSLLAQQVGDRQDPLCSLLLACPFGPEPLAAHLAKRMVVQLPASQVQQQFRFFDPATFLQLPRLLGTAGMAWLLGPVQACLVPWAGGWTSVAQPGPGSGTATGHSRFKLTDAHLAGLLRLGVVNRQAMQMAPPSNAHAWELACANIDLHVQRAMSQHGLQQQADLQAFASHAVEHHPAFDAHPYFQSLFGTLRAAQPQDELDYRELSSRITPAQWQVIAADMQARFEPPNQVKPALRPTKKGTQS